MGVALWKEAGGRGVSGVGRLYRIILCGWGFSLPPTDVTSCGCDVSTVFSITVNSGWAQDSLTATAPQNSKIHLSKEIANRDTMTLAAAAAGRRQLYLA